MKKRCSTPSTKRNKKPPVNSQLITKFFSSPGRTQGTPVKDVSSSSILLSPSLKQTTITEMLSPKPTTDQTKKDAKLMHCNRKLKLDVQRNTNEDDADNSDGEEKNCHNKDTESVNCREAFIDLGDCDDELPEINSTSATGKFRAEDVQPESSYFKGDYAPIKCKFEIDAILEEREKQTVINSEQKKMEEELQNNFSFNSKILEENGLMLLLDEASSLDDRKVQEIRPGIELFDLSKCFSLYSNPPLPKQIRNLPFDDQFFSIVTRGALYNFITMGRIEVFARQLSSRPEILSYIFQLMSTHRDCHLVNRCFCLLNTIKREYSTTWRPSITDFLTVLVNCGANSDKLIPSTHMDQFDFSQLTFSKDGHSPQKSPITCLPLNNLSHLFRTMTSFIEVESNYEDDDLFVMLFAVCSVGGERLLINAMLGTEIEDVIDAIVSSFTEDYWTIKLNEMVGCMLMISSHHHDRVFIAQLMPSTPRGFELQKHFSFRSLASLFDIETSEINIMHPSFVLSLLKQKSLYELSDYYVLHSAIELIDLVVGCEFGRSVSRKLLDELTSIIRKTASKIRDDASCLAGTEIKNFMVRLMSRWSMLANRLPSSQPTLFNSFPRDSGIVIEEVSSSQNNIDDEDDETETESVIQE